MSKKKGKKKVQGFRKTQNPAQRPVNQKPAKAYNTRSR